MALWCLSPGLAQKTKNLARDHETGPRPGPAALTPVEIDFYQVWDTGGSILLRASISSSNSWRGLSVGTETSITCRGLP